MTSLRIGALIKELRIHLCQHSPSSKGVRDFIKQYYVDMKSDNPNLPILIRECSGIEPKLWARYAKGKEKCLSLKGLNTEDILKLFKGLAQPK